MFPPEYPTIRPQTICDLNASKPVWQYLPQQEVPPNIEAIQEECLKLYPEGPPPSHIVLPPGEENLPPLIKTPTPTLEEYPRLNASAACLASASNNFGPINMYCRKTDNQAAISPYDLLEGCQNGGDFGRLDCVDPSTYEYRRQSDFETSQGPGIYLCSDTGDLSRQPCTFNRSEIESKLNQGFRNRYCPVFTQTNQQLEECKTRGWFLDARNKVIYANRGGIMFGVDPEKLRPSTSNLPSGNNQTSGTKNNPGAPINQFYSEPPQIRSDPTMDPGMQEREVLPGMKKPKDCCIM